MDLSFEGWGRVRVGSSWAHRSTHNRWTQPSGAPQTTPSSPEMANGVAEEAGLANNDDSDWTVLTRTTTG